MVAAEPRIRNFDGLRAMSCPSQTYATSLGLVTDLYELTMAHGYFKTGLAQQEASFSLFFRENPFLVRDGEGLSAQVLLDSGRVGRAALERLIADRHTPGLGCLRVFSTGGFEADVLAWAEDPEVPLALFDLGKSSDPAADFCRR